MPSRVTYIIAIVDRAVAFEWVVDLLDGDRFELDFILLNPGPSVLEEKLAQRKIPCERVTYRGYRDLPGALWRVIRIATEFIQDGRNALVVLYRAPAHIAEAILRILADDTLAHGLSQAGRNDVESRFRAEGMVEALSAIYGES